MKEKWADLKENIDRTLEVFSEEVKNHKKKNIYSAIIFLESKENYVKDFLQRDICPPIFYHLDKGKDMDTVTLWDYYVDDIIITDIKDLIFSTEVKKYYLDQMDKWINEESNKYIQEFVKEIKFNFENNNIYSTTLNLFTLIEHRINWVTDQNIDLINRYENKKKNNVGTIRNVLAENCFKYNSEGKLIAIYDKFLDYKSCAYLYRNTKDEKKIIENISRHMLHGDRLDLINKENMMSLIFFTDCIYKMLFTE